jgi:mono/diheme cytochrome c family protein
VRADRATRPGPRSALVALALILGLVLAGCDRGEISSGERLFDNHCVQCHGRDGRGSLGPGLRDVLIRSGWSGQDDETLVAARDALRDVILQGRVQRGRAPMPAFAGRFSDAELEALIDHIVALQRTR